MYSDAKSCSLISLSCMYIWPNFVSRVLSGNMSQVFHVSQYQWSPFSNFILELLNFSCLLSFHLFVISNNVSISDSYILFFYQSSLTSKILLLSHFSYSFLSTHILIQMILHWIWMGVSGHFKKVYCLLHFKYWICFIGSPWQTWFWILSICILSHACHWELLKQGYPRN